jgi:polyisoprenoid-binding protein YceI
MHKTTIAVAATLALGLGGLGLGVTSGAGSRTFAESAAVQGAYQIDPVHSSIIFRIKHLNVAYFHGRFNQASGSFLLDRDNPENSVIDVTIQTESVDTANRQRDEHLRSGDFFNVRQFPTATFKSTEVSKTGDDEFQVKGDLTIHGVTKQISTTVRHTGEGANQRGTPLAGFETVFTISRGDFGITYMPDGLGDDVRLTISLEGMRR